MATFRSVFYWFLLLASTMVIGGVAFYLLSKEAARLEQLKRSSLAAKAQTVADNMDLIVAEVKDGLMANLAALPTVDVLNAINIWKLDNSLVGDVFLWSPEEGFSMGEAYREHLVRDGDWVWKNAEGLADLQVVQQAQQDTYSGRYAKVKGQRQKIRSMSQQNIASFNSFSNAFTSNSVQNNAESPFSSGSEQGWFWAKRAGDSLLIGWFRMNSFAPVRGVVVFQADLLSHLDAALPDSSYKQSGERYELIRNDDTVGFGKTLPRDSGLSSFDSEVLVGSELPGWRLRAYSMEHFMRGPGFMWLGTVLVGILVVAMLLGGTLLFRQARANAIEAARKTTFVSNVSHELKTPLTTIRMYSELLGENRVQSEEKQRYYLNTIIAETQRLTRLVNNVLDFSRLERGVKQYNLESVAVKGLLSSVVEAQRLRFQQVGQELHLEVCDEQVYVHVDVDALEQVLLNLLDNALKYASGGKQVLVALNAGREGDIEIVVADEGPGIAASQVKRIFNTFYRADDSLTAKQPGCGLGLSIARKLLEDIGGSLHYEPNRPCGARFKIILQPISSKTELKI